MEEPLHLVEDTTSVVGKQGAQPANETQRQWETLAENRCHGQVHRQKRQVVGRKREEEEEEGEDEEEGKKGKEKEEEEEEEDEEAEEEGSEVELCEKHVGKRGG
jgi:hypothetical protein